MQKQKYPPSNITKISDFAFDVSKGLFLASLAGPIFSPWDILFTMRTFVSSLLLLFFSLELLTNVRHISHAK